jgi:hypothetical protein
MMEEWETRKIGMEKGPHSNSYRKYRPVFFCPEGTQSISPRLQSGVMNDPSSFSPGVAAATAQADTRPRPFVRGFCTSRSVTPD